MLRVLAVEDEAPQLEELLYLLRADPRVTCADGASDSTEALRRIGQAVDGGPDSAIDVIFLDINMPGLNGLDVARVLAGFADPPLVVFVTAHDGYAVQAFDLEAVDYVLKPVHRDRLAEAVRRAAEQVTAARDGRARGTPADPSVQDPREPASVDNDHIPVELSGVTRFVAVDDILYAEAHGDYARLYTARETHLVRVPLSTLEEEWRTRGFVRIHRSHLVALKRIDEMRLDRGSLTVRVGTAVLTVSRRHASELRELMLRRAKDG